MFNTSPTYPQPSSFRLSRIVALLSSYDNLIVLLSLFSLLFFGHVGIPSNSTTSYESDDASDCQHQPFTRIPEWLRTTNGSGGGGIGSTSSSSTGTGGKGSSSSNVATTSLPLTGSHLGELGSSHPEGKRGGGGKSTGSPSSRTNTTTTGSSSDENGDSEEGRRSGRRDRHRTSSSSSSSSSHASSSSSSHHHQVVIQDTILSSPLQYASTSSSALIFTYNDNVKDTHSCLYPCLCLFVQQEGGNNKNKNSNNNSRVVGESSGSEEPGKRSSDTAGNFYQTTNPNPAKRPYSE